MRLFQRLPAGRIASLLRKLAAQGAMSAIVMVGLNAASIGAVAFKEWLETPSDRIAVNQPAGPAAGAQFTFVGVPASEALPQREIAGPAPQPTSSASQTEGNAQDRQERQLAQAAASKSIAVPTPRPVRVAMAEPGHASRPVERRPADLPFDLSARKPAESAPTRAADAMASSGAPELVSDVAFVPEPGDTSSSTLAGLMPSAIIPSGQDLLRDATDVTMIASDAVIGTASRVLDLVR